ncbi:urea carboxylase-associated family protein [Chthonobacter albigriseus]|uniref:urea carboxylase-associated family protein n=1 Tax=Chthonobacter albigriseus TaxID=1683161 RepID=UPI0015EEA9AF|nr:urea carboxylase-associated family protein [Chthonobacter albigriseus]
MPLLMIEPETGPLPPVASLTVAGGAVAAVTVAKGQFLAVTDLEGGQPAALFAAMLDDPGQVLSPHHTRVFSNSFLLRLGMRLVTNRRRPAMVLGVSPDHLRHDLLMPVTEASVNGPEGGANAVRAKVAAAFRGAGLEPQKLADPVNLFLDVAVNLDGSLSPQGVSSRAGDTVVFRVVRDMVAVVGAPHADPELWDRATPGPIAVRTCNQLADLADLLKRG